jgi:metal-responsive CopG/Arc/MetJ family transcriptional regulator
MPKTAKVAISLPQDILNDVEKERKARGESRSEFFRHAVKNYLHGKKESAAVREYISGYRKMPESSEELGALEQFSLAALSGESWE